jgi:hypothetical protein
MGGDGWINQIAAEAPKTRKVPGPVVAVSRRGLRSTSPFKPRAPKAAVAGASGPRRGSLRARARRRYSRLARTRPERCRFGQGL